MSTRLSPYAVSVACPPPSFKWLFLHLPQCLLSPGRRWVYTEANYYTKVCPIPRKRRGSLALWHCGPWKLTGNTRRKTGCSGGVAVALEPNRPFSLPGGSSQDPAPGRRLRRWRRLQPRRTEWGSLTQGPPPKPQNSWTSHFTWASHTRWHEGCGSGCIVRVGPIQSHESSKSENCSQLQSEGDVTTGGQRVATLLSLHTEEGGGKPRVGAVSRSWGRTGNGLS